MIHSAHKQKFISLLALTLLTSVFLLYPYKKAEAIPTTEVGPQLGFISQITGFTAISASGSQTLVVKEYALDKIGWAIANIVIQEMSHNIVNWINSGFDGNPAFVTDLGGFLTDISDKVAGSFIEGTELGLLCDPFQLQIRRALAINYNSSFGKTIECRLSNVVNNIDNFLSGNFESGGWDGWYELTVQDNPYSRYLQASESLNARIVNARGRELKLLDWGNGFLSWKECGGSGATDSISTANCPVVTPGKVIESQLNDTLDSGRNRLIVADEIDEIIGALLTQLTQQALSGSGGLFGLSQNQNGQPSYTSRLRADSTATNKILNKAKETVSKEISSAIKIEETYKNTVLSSLSTILSTEKLNATLSTCDPIKTGLFTSTILLRKNSISEKATLSEQRLQNLNTIQTEISTASNPNDLKTAIQPFLDLQTSGALRTEADIRIARKESASIIQEMKSLQTNINTAIAECGSTNNTSQNSL